MCLCMSLQVSEDGNKVKRKTPVRYLTEDEVDARTVYVVRIKLLCFGIFSLSGRLCVYELTCFL